MLDLFRSWLSAILSKASRISLGRLTETWVASLARAWVRFFFHK